MDNPFLDDVSFLKDKESNAQSFESKFGVLFLVYGIVAGFLGYQLFRIAKIFNTLTTVFCLGLCFTGILSLVFFVMLKTNRKSISNKRILLAFSSFIALVILILLIATYLN